MGKNGKRVVMFWDKVAGVYDIFAEIINRKTHRQLKSIVADMIEPSDEVLECACGTGMLSAVIAPRCKKLVATDLSAEMLKRTRKKCASYPNTEVRKANILDLDFSDGCFDMIVAANVIHLLDDPERAVSELVRVCRTGGSVIIPTYINRDRKGKTSAFARTVGKAGADFKHQFTLSSYKEFFIQNGFDNVKVVPIHGRIPCAVAVIRPGKENTA